MSNSPKWIILGGLGAALGATACCILPLVLFALGISGAWIGTLTDLNKYQPIFITVALLCFGMGFYWVYFRPQKQCDSDSYCSSVKSNYIVKFFLWLSLILIVLAVVFPYIAPLFMKV